jgi:predicted secreted Zn-dependent protease
VNSLLGRSGAILAMLYFCLGLQTQAQPLTTYVHYLVTGDSAQHLFESMLSNGPRVGGGKAYASTKMDPTVSASTLMTKGQCRITSFKMNLTFTIRLPQLKDDQNLDPALRQSFERFYSFAKRHEETHRAIWLACAAEAEALAMSVTAASCAQAEARSLSLVEEVTKRCDRRHAEFDASEQKVLSKHPFLKQALLQVRSVPEQIALPPAGQQQAKVQEGALAPGK